MSDSSFASPMRLFEILHSLPEIMREGDSITPNSDAEVQHPGNVEKMASFSQKCLAFETILKAWYKEIEERYQAAHRQRQQRSESPTQNHAQGTLAETSQLYWFETSTLYMLLDPDSSARIFPLFICFVNPDIAYQIVLHWTGLLLMYSSLHRAYARLRPPQTDTPSPPSNQSKFDSNPRTLALLIAQSLEYFVHPDMGLLGTNIIGFPLSVSQGFFQHTRAVEVLWYDVIFERIREMRSGLRGFLDDMAKGNTVKLVRPWNRDP